MRLLVALPPQHWPVEWHLPWWLAGDLGLPPAIWQALTVCNLLGLGYVRVQDHLAEGGDALEAAFKPNVLAGALHEAALAELAALFWSTPRFWQLRHGYMAQWLRSLQEGDRWPVRPYAQWRQEDFASLAWRGAPLKITAMGACLLAGRTDVMQPLTAALDPMLVAQVLLDHAADWAEDLPGQRFNALVACASDAPQTGANVGINRRRVLRLLMLSDSKRAYFSQIEARIDEARACAAEAGCRALVDYLAAFQVEAQADADELICAAQAHLRRTVDHVLIPAEAEPARR